MGSESNREDFPVLFPEACEDARAVLGIFVERNVSELPTRY
jgi:hypothetical protein